MSVVLALLTLMGSVVAIVALVGALMTGKTWLRDFLLGGVALWFVLYTVFLFGSSLTSTERELGFNETKAYCGFYIDCHLHTSVTNIRTARKLGDRIASGKFYIVTVKVSSDARREPLGLTTVDAHVVDRRGREYPRHTTAEQQLSPQPEFERLISPGESFEKQIVFDLPIDVERPRLDISEGYAIDRYIEAVLIDDEDSLLHKRRFFRLEEQNMTAGVK